VEDFFQILFFVLVFVIGPLLQSRKQKNQKQAPPRPQQRPGQVQSRTQPADVRTSASGPADSRTRESEAPSRMEEERSAATMVPEDLWAVLTGQVPAPKPVPQPAPEPWYEEDEDEDLVEAEPASFDADVEPWRPAREEAVSLEKEPKREPTYVVSMETLSLPPRERHAAFHEKIAAPVRAEPQPVRKRQIAGVNLRDAFVIQTVLGRPKALE